ncbi:hypothetical protein HBN50_03745 [Halobacteriovorax sp. GB3]|uniref:hypothetical protein n=1 Tax=Halobacteriovorax sp. GB3 TaxID=2719615 RepID=UPI00235EC212|nr:hypothetical protein [Halobacteriovorax sp. GB3]MDD0852192.1 hypothetical protein [Halobacteriovorax sp. GB3]
MKSKSLFVFFSLISCASAFEFNVAISKMAYENPKESEFEQKKEAGYLRAGSFRIQLPNVKFVLKPNQSLDSSIFLDDTWLYLDDQMFELSYRKEEIPGLNKVYRAELDNFTMLTNDNLLSIEGEYGQLEFDETVFLFKNMNLLCHLNESVLSKGSGVIDSCLNSSKISQYNDKGSLYTDIEYGNEKLKTKFLIESAEVTEDSFNVDTNNFFVVSDDFVVGSEKLSLSCYKEHYSKDIDPKIVVANCLKSADIQTPLIHFSAQKNKVTGAISVDDFRANGKQVLFKGPDVNIQTENNQISFSNLFAFCQLPALDEGFEYSHMANGCYDRSSIGLKSLSLSSMKGNVDIDQMSLNFNEDNFKFYTPNFQANWGKSTYKVKEISYGCHKLETDKEITQDLIVNGCLESSSGLINNFLLDSEQTTLSFLKANLDVKKNRLSFSSPIVQVVSKENTLSLDFLNPEISCQRDRDSELSVESVLRGCFDSSKITVGSVRLSHDNIDSKIHVDKVSVDKNNLFLSSPSGKYSLNGMDNVYKKLKISCGLNASYDLAKNHDWETVLENCLHSTTFSLDSLVAKYNGDSTFRRFGNSLKNFGIKGMSDIHYDSKSHSKEKFTLEIVPKLLSVIPVSVTVKGNISYNRDQKIIDIKVNKTKFYGIIPARFLVQLILKAFVANDSMKVDGNRITIDLNASDDEA